MVSIIVPVYNSEPFLERCLGSLKCQTYTDLEVIMINDGSTDGSEVICRKYCDEDSRFKYYYQNNAGCSAARNNGIKHAVGDYIGFCDSDDWLSADYIKSLITAAQESCSDVAIGGYREHDGEKVIYVAAAKEFGQMSKQELALKFWEFQENFLLNSVCNKLYRRDVISALFDESMTCGEDMQFNMMNLQNISSAVTVDATGYFYYKPPTQSMKYPKNDAAQCLKYSDGIRQFLDSALPEKEYIDKYENYLCCNMCRDVYTISAANPYKTARKMINEFLDKPEFRQVLEHRAWQGAGRKYAVIGRLLSMNMVTPIIIASKLRK